MELNNIQKLTFNANPILNRIRYGGHPVYSVDDSFELLKSFLDTLSYSTKTKRDMLSKGRLIHDKFPELEDLQDEVTNIGLIKTGQQIKEKATSYLYFLAVIGIIKISYGDFFYTNLSTQVRLKEWYEEYKTELGLDLFATHVLNVARSYSMVNINLERQSQKAYKAGIYLILRYGLNNIKELSEDSWYDFVQETRSVKTRVQVVSIKLVHNALWEMGILSEPYSEFNHGLRDKEKARFTECNAEWKTLFDTYIDILKKTKSESTIRLACDALEHFYNYMLGQVKEPQNLKIKGLKRTDILDYLSALKIAKNDDGENFAQSWIENRSYTLKNFLKYISFNSKEFEAKGIKIFDRNIVVDSDFTVKQEKRLPRPIENEVLQVFLNTLSLIHNKLYRCVFLLLLHTGIAIGDLLCLKQDCLDDKGMPLLEVYRIKIKKSRIVSIFSNVPIIIKELQQMNTQRKPTPHPDGQDAIYLINDGGEPQEVFWFKHWFKLHKELVKQNSRFSKELDKITPYSLRHTFACILRDKGFTIQQIQKLMLHERMTTTTIYTNESDQQKIQVLKKCIERGDYTCDSLPENGLSPQYLNSEEGLKFLENMFSYENKFLGGRCTVNGRSNCSNAYRCITCDYLCSTPFEIPEILHLIQTNIARYKKYKENLKECNDIFVAERLLNEIKIIKARILKLKLKYEKLNEIKQKLEVDKMQDTKLFVEVNKEDETGIDVMKFIDFYDVE